MISIEEAINYIENQGWSMMRLGLSRTRALLCVLDNPQKSLKFIHVAGSNGKGSTCAMLDMILRKAGYRTGLYTSPYVQEFSERMRINGRNIDDDSLCEITQKVRDIAEGMEDHPSQFEIVTAIAMEYFAREHCDIVVLETGMGGEFDSTNVIDAPVVSVITNIGYEHTEYLGDTLSQIASAKAGIIKEGSRAVCYDCDKEAVDVIKNTCRKKNVPLSIVDFGRIKPLNKSLDGQEFTWDGHKYSLNLIGDHQLCNAATVLTAVEALNKSGFNISDENIMEALESVKWPARMEVLGKDPVFILDGAHNPQCVSALTYSLKEIIPEESWEDIIFILGVLKDKDYPKMVYDLLTLSKNFICVTPDNERALDAAELADFLKKRGANAKAVNSPEEAVNEALAEACAVTKTFDKGDADTARGSASGIVVSLGSLYLAGDIRASYFKRK